jgi:hypothetical protein
LHDQVGVARLTLSYGRVEVGDKDDINVVSARQGEEFNDAGIENFVVVRLAAQAEEGREEVDIVAPPAKSLSTDVLPTPRGERT